MKTASVAELKKRLSAYLAAAEQGEDVQVRKRNLPIARLVGIPRVRKNMTKLGYAKGTVAIRGDLTEPMVPPSRWDMLKGEHDS
jgi:prevent-host-death family protein